MWDGTIWDRIGLWTQNNNWSGTNKFGDSTNYTQVSSSGFQTLHGNARVHREVKIDASIVNKGASAPTTTTRAVGASGGVACPVIQFSKVTQQDVYFHIHAQSDTDSTANVTFHVMWLPGSGWTTGNYVWKLEYLIKYEDATYGNADISTGTPTTISADVTPANNHTHIETEFATGIDLNEHQVMCCHFYRDVATDNADDVGEVTFFEIEYVKNSLGEPIT
jgi:hypothetical protein